MMKKVIYTLVLLIAASFALGSCVESLDNDDNEAPAMYDVRSNRSDTLIYLKDSIKIEGKPTKYIMDSIYINLHQAGADTVVIGKSKVVKFGGRFVDNEELSSFKIEIFEDPLNMNTTSLPDTVFRSIKGWSFKDWWVNKYKEAIVDQRRGGNLITLNDSVSVTKEGKAIKLPYREGAYRMKVVAMDRTGNRDSVYHDLILLYEKTIIDLRIN